jgi:hypothetical protein
MHGKAHVSRQDLFTQDLLHVGLVLSLSLLALDNLDGHRRRETRAYVYHDFKASYDVPSSVRTLSIAHR